MGVRILVGTERGGSGEQAVLFCSTSGWAFGPVFDDGEEEAAAFLKWLVTDPRVMRENELERKYHDFRALTRDKHGDYVGLPEPADVGQ